MIILAAPDIDIDVFKSQMRRFGKPSKPFFIILSKDDRALGASQFVGGGDTRVSDDPNVAELAALGAMVINLSDVKADDPSNHDKFAQLAEVAPGLRGDSSAGLENVPGVPPLGGGRKHPRLGHRVAGHASRRARQDHRGRIGSHPGSSRPAFPPNLRLRGGDPQQPLYVDFARWMTRDEITPSGGLPLIDSPDERDR